MLVGGSSVGKTRACYEAVAEVLPGWPVFHPDTAEELLGWIAAGIAPGSVVWLNETQRYLQPPHGRDVAVALRRLLTRPAQPGPRRVVVLGSMWLNPHWQAFTRPDDGGRPNEQPQIRDLLTTLCRRVDVAEDFQVLTDDQRADLHHLAARDSRLAMAVAAGGPDGRLTQVLAGGPLLLQHYADLKSANPAAHAVLTAAMDARRIGYQSPLPPVLLEQAAPGYLTPAQRVVPAGWLGAAIAAAAQEIHGVRALTPIRTDDAVGEPGSYLLHDYLAQHAIGPRRREPIRASLWDATITHAHDPGDLDALTIHTHRRALDALHLRLLRARADHDDRYAAELAEVLSDRGKGGDAEALAELRDRADHGDWYAAERLADVLAWRGDAKAITELRREVNAGNDIAAAKALLNLYAAGNPERRRELDRYGLDPDGRPADPW